MAGSSSLRDTVAGWLASAGFIVAPADSGLPSGAEWGLLVATPPPIQVRMRLIGLRNGSVIAGIGINFADVHRRELNRLQPAERSAFIASMMARLIAICPYCRFALQGGMVNPEAIIAEILYSGDALEKQRLIDDMARLVNIFMAINMMLWEKFPEAQLEQGEAAQTGTGFM